MDVPQTSSNFVLIVPLAEVLKIFSCKSHELSKLGYRADFTPLTTSKRQAAAGGSAFFAAQISIRYAQSVQNNQSL
jgi:hypothetical protein